MQSTSRLRPSSPMRLALLLLLALLSTLPHGHAAADASGGFVGDAAAAADDRSYWVQLLLQLADPVLTALSENRLKSSMPAGPAARQAYDRMEATTRVLAGIAPWLELGPGSDAEGKLRAACIQRAVAGLTNAVNASAPDHLDFSGGPAAEQPLAEAAWLSLALLRAPRQLWGGLSSSARAHVVAALRQTRRMRPLQTNWLLFSAVVEVALWEFTGKFNSTPIATAISKHWEWYLGGGAYGDGPSFHWDHYNGFVIHPLLLAILDKCRAKGHPLGARFAVELQRAQYYAAAQEQLISPEGTFPVLGRSSTYRFGAFHLLADVALRRRLPDGLAPGAVRSGMSAVLRRMAGAPGTFDAEGWLQVGVVGHQPGLADPYTSSGSGYFCATALLPLGLPPEDEFWAAPAAAWTQARVWAGEDVAGTHAVHAA